jgi:hypothetical protein
MTLEVPTSGHNGLSIRTRLPVEPFRQLGLSLNMYVSAPSRIKDNRLELSGNRPTKSSYSSLGLPSDNSDLFSDEDMITSSMVCERRVDRVRV